jgi:DNA-binding transcriptional MocR family regulator
MKKHAAILRPKFEAVIQELENELGDTGVATWTKPRGGYFISFDSTVGVASDVYALCVEAGLTLTKVGDTFPYGNDPENTNIRIAPSFPSVEQLKAAVERFIVCVKIASIEKILSERNNRAV